MEEQCAFSRLDCSLGEGQCYWLLQFWPRVCLESFMLMLYMSLQRLEGFVLIVMDSSGFHCDCCSCKNSSNISSFNLDSIATSCVGSWCLIWILVQILCVVFVLNLGLQCLGFSVTPHSLMILGISSVCVQLLTCQAGRRVMSVEDTSCGWLGPSIVIYQFCAP